MFEIFFHKKIDEHTASNIIAAFMTWYGQEFQIYTGDNDKSMLRNIALTHPSVFNDPDLGMEKVKRYFVDSNSSDQRVATRLACFVSKITIIFGVDIIDQFKARCLRSMIEDLHIRQDLMMKYVSVSDLFWTYPILLMAGNLDMREMTLTEKS